MAELEAISNWAGNLVYGTASLALPTTVEELQALVASGRQLKPLGSRHSFSDVADTGGTLVSVAHLPSAVEVDEGRRCATVSAGMRYSDVASALERSGWALANLASLPHISVAGSVATGTHGSGDTQQSLAAAVSALEFVGADGELRSLRRGDPDFDGAVVSLGALGVVTQVTLDVEPTFTVRQQVYRDLPLDVLEERFDDVTGSGDSVSVFLNWGRPFVDQVWVKSRGPLPDDLLGSPPADTPMHMIAGASSSAVTEQGGVPGPWHERLPHFKPDFTPSSGEELQSEYLMPRAHSADLIATLRQLGPILAPLLQVSEIRTVAADDLWLSGCYRQETVAVHFTWVPDSDRVLGLLPMLEDRLSRFGARPHWGKCFAVGGERLEALYPRLPEFRALVDRWDPTGKFRSPFLSRTLSI